jgi:hypothetical protein
MSGARKAMPSAAQRPLPALAQASAELLAAPIAETLELAGGQRLPVHAVIADELVRYFIVTPPANGARMQDLRAAAAVRFQMLYGDALSDWELVADWHAAAPFLACAVPRRVPAALQIAVKAQQGCVASVTPAFVAAWNRSRRRVSADAWLATFADGALTIGLLGAAPRAHLAAVRTIALPQAVPPLAWLRDQVARAALLDNVTAPSTLHIHGEPPDAWQPDAASDGDAGLAVQWHSQHERGATR